MKTIWKTIKNYNNYKISNNGDIVNIKYKRYLKPTLSGRNLSYLTVPLYEGNGKSKRFYLHRLLAEHFLKKIDGKNHVNHKDGNKTNNTVELLS